MSPGMLFLRQRLRRARRPIFPCLTSISRLSGGSVGLQASYEPISVRHPLLAALSSCRSPGEVGCLHARLVVSGLACHPFVASKLVELLVALHSSDSSSSPLDYADIVFSTTPSPTLFTYNILIRAHSVTPPGAFNSSLHLFRSLLRDPSGLVPNQYTLAFVLNSCCRRQGEDDEGGRPADITEAEQLRVQATRRGLDTNLYVCNVVIRLYSSWGMMEKAEKVFKECSYRDLFSWNSLIGGYVGVGEMRSAMKLFDEMPNRDVVSWSTLISGYVQEGLFMKAMELFHEMQLSSVAPNEFTLTSILTACSNLVALDQGRWIHSHISRARIHMNERLLSCLIDMYAKCGEIGWASKVFSEGTPKISFWPWNAMLGGFAIHGMTADAVDLFKRMRIEGVNPNKVTFISLLSACSHGSFLDEGKAYFQSMNEVYGIHPEIEHYGCMVDLFGRAGLLKEAEEFISLMPIPPDFVIWSALLNACRIHRDIRRAERVGKIIRGINPQQVGCRVLLANIYSGSGRWAGARNIRDGLEMSGSRKIPGWSAIEMGGIFHQFLVGDQSHPQTRQIYLFLDELNIKLKKAGYEPELGEVLVDVDEEDKETALSIHSEKLAIAFGLMNSAPRTVIRVMKNLRVCIDCHQATKLISKLYDREIIVRDRIRFHYFKDGSCSCKDYW